jgi:hypothetical protein
MKHIALRVISMVTQVVANANNCSEAYGNENLSLKFLCEANGVGCKSFGSKVRYY